MSERDLVVGLDIGTTKTLTLVGSLTGEQLRILGAGTAPSTGLVKGVIVDLEETAAAIRASVAAAERAAGAEIGSVLASLSGDHLASENRRGGLTFEEPREVTESDVRQARRAARQPEPPPERVVLHSIPRQFATDGQEGVRHPVGMTATYLEVEAHVVTAGSSFVDNLAKCVQRAGFDLEDVIASPIASGLAVATEAEQALGVVVIDLGGGATHLAMFRDGSVAYTGAIPVGGNHLSYDLSVGLRLSREEAERIKRASGCARVADAEADETVVIQPVGEEEAREVPRRLLPEILEPRVNQLAELVRDEIARAGESGVVPLSAVVTGGGSLLPGLPAAFAEILGVSTRLGLPRRVEGPEAVLESPAASTAIGLLQLGALRRSGGAPAPEAGWSAGLMRKLSRWLETRRR